MAINLPTLGEMQATRRAQTKGLPHPIAKKQRAKAKAERGKQFRDEVWARDGGRSRATGKPLVRTGSTDWDVLGEVDHAITRSTAPERVYDTSNGILLSKWENRMRKIPCVRAPEHKYFDYTGPINRSLPQTFTWRDDDGKITKQRIG